MTVEGSAVYDSTSKIMVPVRGGVRDYEPAPGYVTAPGRGPKGGLSCGEVSFVGVCRASRGVGDAHDKIVGRHDCGRLTCPVCCAKPIKRRASDVTERLAALVGEYNRSLEHVLSGRGSWSAAGERLRSLVEHTGWSRFDVRHDVFSPPQERAVELHRAGRDGRRRLAREFLRLVKRWGLGVGGAYVYHPWRVSENGKRAFRRARRRGDADASGGLWAWLRVDGGRMRWAYLAPHFHVVGMGWLVPSGEISESSGWVHKRCWSRDISGEGVVDAVRGCFGYLLSHAGLEVDGEGARLRSNSYHWFGSLNSQVSGHSDVLEEEVVTCSHCGDVVERLASCVARGDPGADLDGADLEIDWCAVEDERAGGPGELLRRVRVRRWWLKRDVTVPPPPPRPVVTSGPLDEWCGSRGENGGAVDSASMVPDVDKSVPDV